MPMGEDGPYALVVDDDPDTADITAVLLRAWGFDARALHAAPDALDAARARPPAIVLLDLGMPRVDGCEFARRFRALPGCGAAALVAVTGHSTAPFRALARAAGVDHYLLKPADPDQLRELLVRLAPPAEPRG
jgi:CheY-like chemotaxis protein